VNNTDEIKEFVEYFFKVNLCYWEKLYQ